MAEYLEKSTVIKAIHDEVYSGGNWSGGWYERPEEVAEKNFTERINAITPITKEHGEWVPLNTPRHNEIAVRCSVCNNYAWHGHRSAFCPNCGADMREEKE